MKFFSVPSLLAFWLLSPVCQAQKTGAKSDSDTMVRVQVEFIETGHETLTKLLEERTDADDGKLRGKLKELIAAKQAGVLETLIATGQNGEQIKSESTDEFIYPTEYEPVELICPPPSPEKPQPLPQAAKTPFCPTAFETRNLGSSLEIKPTVGSDLSTVHLNIAPSMTWHTGNLTWAEDKDGNGNVSKIEMPRIYTLRMNASLTCVSGKPLFVAALSPKAADGTTDYSRKVMVFVKSEVIPVK